MTTACFFETPSDASKVKGRIVAKYFEGWANVILSRNVQKIEYVDLLGSRFALWGLTTVTCS